MSPSNGTTNGTTISTHETNGTNGMTPDFKYVNPVELPALYEHCIDDYRPMKVICIGGGISGILASIRFPQKIPNVTFTCYEKNADVGGTWFENKSVFSHESMMHNFLPSQIPWCAVRYSIS